LQFHHPVGVAEHLFLDSVEVVVEFQVGPHGQCPIPHPGIVVAASRGVLVRGSHHCSTALDIQLGLILLAHALVPLVIEPHGGCLPVEVLAGVAVCLVEAPGVVGTHLL
jgi:hypothetical protein